MNTELMADNETVEGIGNERAAVVQGDIADGDRTLKAAASFSDEFASARAKITANLSEARGRRSRRS